MRNKNAMQQTGVDVSYDLWEAACEGGWVVKDATDKNKGKQQFYFCITNIHAGVYVGAGMITLIFLDAVLMSNNNSARSKLANGEPVMIEDKDTGLITFHK